MTPIEGSSTSSANRGPSLRGLQEKGGAYARAIELQRVK